MAQLTWNPDLELGVPRMDTTHREFVDLLAALADVPDASFASALDRMIEHTVEHFGQEDRWMEQSGFGPMCHLMEHQKVLDVMRQVRERVATGDLDIGRKLAFELGRWFEHHASTMDTILVSHMVEVGFDPEAARSEPSVLAP
ncbi:MAG: hypothetical protein RIS35_1760 [Pseudomonadota bacterium]|jgi:hemerythrin-like metal-binding protein